MHVPKGFEKDLWSVYTGELDFDKFIAVQSPFLKRFSGYFCRNLKNYDADDMYQEACYWLVKLLWSWDKDRGVPLARYVVYNIGSRLQNIAFHELRELRLGVQVSIWEPVSDNFSLPLENILESPTASPEVTSAIRHALNEANESLSKIARDLATALANEGRMTNAARDLYAKNIEYQRIFVDESHLLKFAKEYVMPEIRQYLDPIQIIPSD